MSPGRRITPYLVAMAIVGCTDEPSTAIALGGPDERLDLQLSVPVVSPDRFVTHEFVELDAATDPALVLGGELPPDGEDPTTIDATIWNAYTDVQFWTSQVEAWGEHDYTGNKGRVEVTAEVRHDDALIGSRTAATEQSHSFLNPFAHHIIGNVLVNIDADCGLAADAHSSHSAWWEMYPGSGPSTFNREVVPTTAGRKAQPSCQPTSGGGGGGGGGVEMFECWIWLEYDLATLEILDWQVLWCSGGG